MDATRLPRPQLQLMRVGALHALSLSTIMWLRKAMTGAC